MADPARLAAGCVGLPRPWLVGVDVDGTLAPIVARPELSCLAPSAREALDDLAHCAGVMVAVVSGRPLADLRHRFALPSSVMLLGSHGAEVGNPINCAVASEVGRCAADEQRLLDETLAHLAMISTGLAGSWVEHKPLAAALHVRQSEPAAAAAVLTGLERTLSARHDLTLHRGHMVLEVAVRPSTKATAFGQLCSRLQPATTFFVGDDASDELVFATLRSGDVSIKVGPGDSAADHRLPSPTEVVAWLLETSALLNTAGQ